MKKSDQAGYFIDWLFDVEVEPNWLFDWFFDEEAEEVEPDWLFDAEAEPDWLFYEFNCIPVVLNPFFVFFITSDIDGKLFMSP